MIDLICQFYNEDIQMVIEREWLRYGMRVSLANDWMYYNSEMAWEYVHLRFWRTPQAKRLTYGPLHIRELPWSECEMEQGFAKLEHTRYEIRHWGWNQEGHR